MTKKWMTPEQTWAAETRANERVNGIVEPGEHSCPNCYNKALGMKSPLRCRNEPGGW